MDDQKYFPASVLTILLIALYFAITHYFLPEIEKQAFDVAASIWFVFTPLYLFVKRMWLVKKLDRKIYLSYDIILCLVVNMCLGYTAYVTTPEFSARVFAVWGLCIALWIAIFRTKKEEEAE